MREGAREGRMECRSDVWTKIGKEVRIRKGGREPERSRVTS